MLEFEKMGVLHAYAFSHLVPKGTAVGGWERGKKLLLLLSRVDDDVISHMNSEEISQQMHHVEISISLSCSYMASTQYTRTHCIGPVLVTEMLI